MIKVRDEGPVRWLTLNRPAKRNALNAAMVTALKEALTVTGNARCIAITGAGNTFSAGADLAALQAMQHGSYEENLADSRHLAELFTDIAKHPLPIVAALNGQAIGGGAGLAVACDFTLAAPLGLIGFTEVHVGFIPAIVMNFLVRGVGEKIARDLCLSGRRLPVEEAERLGLLKVVPDLGAAVADLGARIARNSPEAIAATKRHFLELFPLDLEASAAANARARGTADCREGVAAFLEKRNPRWSDEA